MARSAVSTWSNISATPTAFTVGGGLYSLLITATWGGGSVTLQKLVPGTSTYVTCLTAFTADNYQTAYLSAGTYKLLVATASAIYAELASVAET